MLGRCARFQEASPAAGAREPRSCRHRAPGRSHLQRAAQARGPRIHRNGRRHRDPACAHARDKEAVRNARAPQAAHCVRCNRRSTGGNLCSCSCFRSPPPASSLPRLRWSHASSGTRDAFAGCAMQQMRPGCSKPWLSITARNSGLPPRPTPIGCPRARAIDRACGTFAGADAPLPAPPWRPAGPCAHRN